MADSRAAGVRCVILGEHGEEIDFTTWDDEAERRAHQAGGYVVQMDTEPAHILADFRITPDPDLIKAAALIGQAHNLAGFTPWPPMRAGGVRELLTFLDRREWAGDPDRASLVRQMGDAYEEAADTEPEGGYVIRDPDGRYRVTLFGAYEGEAGNRGTATRILANQIRAGLTSNVPSVWEHVDCWFFDWQAERPGITELITDEVYWRARQ